ncbi:SCO family protein [Sutcliffiella rhizosphaerae]|uniref:SCO1 protein n=1 Tax=Sutcliffiella rhizosphaerae TaxID=2880967 RepID=A0ABM8YQ98_9BACI|nr:SCO family protein [Sutcliffiella rhizosphaerae]CAG9621985.1 SCO1 protein [Sutcliffiella rhizosphaerae]
MKHTYLILIIVLSLFLAGCNSQIPDKTNWELDDFQYINQENEPFGLNDLKGDITVATLIFTNCTTVCSPMTANMAKLQRMADEKELDAHFLSFSVDPEVDTPEVLKEFSSRFDADLSNWNFLTGYTQKEIETFGPENFKAIVAKPKNGGDVVHGTSFYLINQEGVIIKSYDGLNVPYEEILKHIEILENQ